ncbi:MAG: protocatechuate 3,4-dioxygenase [Alphaproteobacteria bacterium]|nr:protocatechuate 3,4-dioxygenase [Alphaproteobacteria bacterium]
MPRRAKTIVAPDRRRLLNAGVALGLGAVAAGLPALARAALMPTARQTEGPFYPRHKPADTDNDLARIAGAPGQAAGQIIHVTGEVLAPDGRPIPGARVEIWHADAKGRYHHRGDWSLFRERDGGFQGFGAAMTDDRGRYAFRTIKPPPYGSRTPHIHFKVFAPGIPTLTTQMYFAGEPRNARDGILHAVRNPAARAGLIVPFAPAPTLEQGALQGHFRIVLAQEQRSGA